MGSESQALTGPDLQQGVSWQGLTDGKPLLGHAGGEAVMLVRQGAELFATGASCTHYGGPLAEGLVDGDTVRCPWHHACFDLRTGQAIGAPALNPIPCFEVERRDDLVRVGRKREAPGPAAAAAGPSSVVIVGAGPAGAVCAETLRRLGYQGPITLVADEPPGPVDRPNLSKDYLAGSAPEEWIPLRPPEFFAEQRIDLQLGDAAASLDVAAHRLTLTSGKALSYGALVLATGAEPRRLPVPGAEQPHVFLLRTLADSRAIIARAAGAKRAVVIGASFIGLEAAASLRARGLEVDVVGPEAVPLARVLGEPVGALVRQAHEAKGTRFHLGQQVQAIGAHEVQLAGGASLPADLVVIGVGVAPRTALAQAAGLKVDNGIVVDGQLRTSAADVYAVGDVARYPDPRGGALVRIEHFVVAERQGQAVARILLGDGRPYQDVPFFWSQHPDLGLCYVGHAADWDELYTLGDLAARDFAVFYLRKGRVLAVLTAGRDQLSLRAERALASGDDAALDSLMER
jgi:NADPH-dependent 2,4-dienoyl-CoA reductase/sulfur reductase-like enzyme/nitrite reductase/ring-hydroxylating ferredoxin subunit